MINIQEVKPTFQIDIAKELKNSLESKSPIDLRGIDPIPVSIFCFIENHFMSLLKWGVYNKNSKKEHQ